MGQIHQDFRKINSYYFMNNSANTTFLRHIVFWRGLLCLFFLCICGCKGYSFLSLEDIQPGDLQQRLLNHKTNLTDIKISGELNNKDILYLENIITESDLLSRLDLSECSVSLPNHAFAGSQYLEDVILPKKCEILPHHLFSGCISLKKIIVPSGCEIIEEEAFSDCSNLKSVKLPESLEIIKRGAFKGCKQISQIFCASKEPPTCESQVFDDILNCELIVPKGCAKYYRNAIGWENFKEISEDKHVAEDFDTKWGKN